MTVEELIKWARHPDRHTGEPLPTHSEWKLQCKGDVVDLRCADRQALRFSPAVEKVRVLHFKLGDQCVASDNTFTPNTPIELVFRHFFPNKCYKVPSPTTPKDRYVKLTETYRKKFDDRWDNCNREVVIDTSVPFRLHADTVRDGFGGQIEVTVIKQPGFEDVTVLGTVGATLKKLEQK